MLYLFYMCAIVSVSIIVQKISRNFNYDKLKSTDKKYKDEPWECFQSAIISLMVEGAFIFWAVRLYPHFHKELINIGILQKGRTMKKNKSCYNCWYKCLGTESVKRFCHIYVTVPDWDASACGHYRPGAIAKLDEVIELLEKVVENTRPARDGGPRQNS